MSSNKPHSGKGNQGRETNQGQGNQSEPSRQGGSGSQGGQPKPNKKSDVVTEASKAATPAPARR